MAQIAVSNWEVHQQASSIYLQLLNNCWLKLFTNDFAPNAATVRDDFIEALFPGYSPIDVSPIFPLPSKVSDGFYQSKAASQQFVPTFDSTEIVYGWWIQQDLEVLFCSRFDTPKTVLLSVPIIVQITLQTFSRAVACP